MIPLPHFANQTVAVLGLGASGKAVWEALSASGAHVLAWDDQASSDDIPLTPYRDWDWERLSCIVMSPGIPLHHPEPHPLVALAEEHNVRITCDISLLMEACPEATYIGITGTNGKSTTTALIAHCLQALGAEMHYGGNIGIPALVMEPLHEGGIYVLELSSYQLDLMDSGVLNVACLLNITPDHLDRHGGMEGYVAAKKRIFQGQSSNDTAIVAVDDVYTKTIAESLPHTVRVTLNPRNAASFHMEDGWIVDTSEVTEARCDLALVPSLTGVHNYQNAMVALAVCKALGYRGEDIYEAMLTFPGLPHRMEQLGIIDGVLCINDSKATNAEAAACSLDSFGQIYWIVGGVAKDGGIAALVPYFEHVAHAYCIGESAEAFAKTLAQHQVAHTVVHTLDEAVKQAFSDARGQQNAVLLLAPAAASFDQFKNFEERGNRFRALIEQLHV